MLLIKKLPSLWVEQIKTHKQLGVISLEEVAFLFMQPLFLFFKLVLHLIILRAYTYSSKSTFIWRSQLNFMPNASIKSASAINMKVNSGSRLFSLSSLISFSVSFRPDTQQKLHQSTFSQITTNLLSRAAHNGREHTYSASIWHQSSLLSAYHCYLSG